MAHSRPPWAGAGATPPRQTTVPVRRRRLAAKPYSSNRKKQTQTAGGHAPHQNVSSCRSTILARRTRKCVPSRTGPFPAHRVSAHVISGRFSMRRSWAENTEPPGFGSTLQRDLKPGHAARLQLLLPFFIARRQSSFIRERTDGRPCRVELWFGSPINHAAARRPARPVLALDLAQQGQTGVELIRHHQNPSRSGLPIPTGDKTVEERVYLSMVRGGSSKIQDMLQHSKSTDFRTLRYTTTLH